MKKFYLFLTALLVSAAANADDWYLTGTVNNWSEADGSEYKFSESETLPGFMALNLTELSGQFKIRKQGTWNDAMGSWNDNPTISLGEPYQGHGNGNDISVVGTIRNATIYINENTYNIVIAGEKDGVEFPASLYVQGIPNWEAAGTPMTRDRNVYTAEFNELTEGAEFKINNGTWDLNWGAASDINIGSLYPAYNNGDNSIVVQSMTNAKIVFFYSPDKNSTVTLTGTPKPTGVENITVEDNDDAPYYNLQGIRVANPQPGNLYIHNGKKLIFR